MILHVKNIRWQGRRLFNVKKINKYDLKKKKNKTGVFKIQSQEVWDIASISFDFLSLHGSNY